MSFAFQLKIIANGRWHFILASLGVPEQCLRNKHGPCPSCGGRDRFRYDDKNGDGTFYCNNCGAGDGFKLLQLVHGWSFPEALQHVSDLLRGAAHNLPARTPIAAPESDEPDWERYRSMQALWAQSVPISKSDPAGLYLMNTRGLQLSSFPECLRYHPNVLTYEDGKKRYFPALLARFDDPQRQMVQVQRIFLTPSGEKALGKQSKKLMPGWKEGATTGGAIRLFEPTDVLAVGEGIETCLGYHILSGGTPAWASYSANSLQRVVLPISVLKVIILADNDENSIGQEAADQLAVRLFEEGREVRILTPNETGKDFADLLRSSN